MYHEFDHVPKRKMCHCSVSSPANEEIVVRVFASGYFPFRDFYPFELSGSSESELQALQNKCLSISHDFLRNISLLNFFFLLNLGRRYHIKYKAQAEMLHNTEKHKNNDSRGEFQN